MLKVESWFPQINFLKFFEKKISGFHEENEIRSLDKSSTTRRKCGEIFFDDQLISFSCSFCQKQFQQLEMLFCHLAQLHLTIDENSVIQVKTKIDNGQSEWEDIPRIVENDVDESLKSNDEIFRPRAVDCCEEEKGAKSKVLDNTKLAMKIPDETNDLNGIHEFEFVDQSECNKSIRISVNETTIEQKEYMRKRNKVNTSFPLICEFCGKICQFNKQLQRHIKLHKGIKTYTCDICDHKFADKSNLNAHKLRHLGIKPHRCDICEKSFTASTELKTHKLWHSNERPFVCMECGRGFVRANLLRFHQRIHQNERIFACSNCEKRFNTKWGLHCHEISHLNERLYKCKVCKASFNYSRNLKTHMELHSGVKEYVCKVCSKAFAQRAGLISHTKTHKTQNT